MKKLMMLLIVALGLLFVSFAPEVNAAAKVSLSAKKASLSVGTSKKLKLKNAKNVTWKSSNKKIATVTKDGKEIDKDDAFYVSFAGYTREYWITTSKVHSVYADKYVIDIDSDGAVHKTLAPKKEDV